MSVESGPDIITNGLVLGFDGANTRSFRGEPTTNTLPNPTVNAYPTTGNGWGTYNTNQYGSGNFFSIGTVSSVSNNIVTMTTAHSLRTYDVMRPQTTGGGVTANTDYFIKKVSSTQFSLHEYNSSQDGSQGYINSSTGTHKVYDSLANDTRISINSTNFPTMWWGAPHLPNSGLVKEILTKGFRHPDTQVVTDCIRLHYIRTDDVKDGMAYSVDANVVSNQPVTVSFYTRAASAAAEGKVIQYYIYNYGSIAPNTYAWNFTLGPPGVWQRQTFTYTPINEYMISYWFPQSGGVYSWEWSNMQVEQKSYATAFVAGTRGTTVANGGGLTNLIPSGNSTGGELVNGPTFNSDKGGNIVFDGSNDYIDFSAGTLGGTATVEMWAKIGSGYSGKMFFGWLYYDIYCPAGHIGYNTGNGDCYGVSSSTVSSLGLVGNWAHYVFEMRSDVAYTNNKIYINGVQQSLSQLLSSEAAGNRNFNSGNGRIGVWRGDTNYCMPMNCATFAVYNGSLTADQVRQNFEATRARFGV